MQTKRFASENCTQKITHDGSIMEYLSNYINSSFIIIYHDQPNAGNHTWILGNNVSKASTNNHSYDDERGDYMVVLRGNSVL